MFLKINVHTKTIIVINKLLSAVLNSLQHTEATHL